MGGGGGGARIEKKVYNFYLCAIFKNEAKYLKEWIEYHLLLGVEHFYLYNNFSSDDYLDVLQYYIDVKLVTLYDWPYPQGQSSAYEHCFTNHSKDTSWLACIDIDEFIVPKYETTIPNWLKPYEKYPSVAIYWKVFGTSGYMKTDENMLITERYTVCWNKFHVTKTIFNTSYKVADYKDLHLFSAKHFRIHLAPINEFKQFLYFSKNRQKSKKHEPTIQINHYWSKSYSEFIIKSQKGDAYFVDSPRNINYFLAHETQNISCDYIIYRFLIQLKLRLGITE
jgi:hypothetical protein